MKKTNKWQFHFYFGRNWATMERGWKQFELGILRIHTMPDEGVAVGKRNYKGFILKFFIWLPIDF